MLTDRQKYFSLMAQVCEKLTSEAVDKAIRADYPLSSTTLNNVRIGRAVNLPALVALVQYGLPEHEIPSELLPAA